MLLPVDLNCDLGESFGCYTVGEDLAILEWVTSINIACGFHAGDYNVMRQTVQRAKEHGIAIGAHPGFQDLIGFGRRKMEVSPEEVYNLVLYQIGALNAFTQAEHVPLHHVKPHGALYNMAAKQRDIAQAIANAVADFDSDLILYALAGSELVDAGRERGLVVKEEAFADRSYLRDGTLTPRHHPGAIFSSTEEALEQVLRMVHEGVVIALDGSVVPIQADTICIHGDHPHATQFAKRIVHGLRGAEGKNPA